MTQLDAPYGKVPGPYGRLVPASPPMTVVFDLHAGGPERLAQILRQRRLGPRCRAFLRSLARDVLDAARAQGADGVAR
jgi:hypothetical protein